MPVKSIYLVGSLSNSRLPYFAQELRELGFVVYDQWWAPGPLADSYWRHYIKIRGLNYRQALQDLAGQHIFEFDRGLIDKAEIVVAFVKDKLGISASLELGYARGKGKEAYVLFETEPKRYDVMMAFLSDIFFSKQELFDKLKAQTEEQNENLSRRKVGRI